MQMLLVPFTSIGEFKLDDSIENYSEILSKYFHTPTDFRGDDYYHKSNKGVENTHFLKVKDGKIRSVYCYESVMFDDVNLIGLTLEEFKKITKSDFVGEVYEMKDDGEIKYIYDFDSVGMQIRTYQNKVIDIIVSGFWTYEKNPIKMDFIPFERVGIFQLDDDFANYADTVSNYIHKKDDFGGDEYHFGDDDIKDDSHFLSVEDGKIRSIFCYEELIYKNTNLIGLTLDEFIKITESNYVGEVDEMDIHEDEPPEYVYEFDGIGAQVWTHYGRVVTVIVAGYWSYEDD